MLSFRQAVAGGRSVVLGLALVAFGVGPALSQTLIHRIDGTDGGDRAGYSVGGGYDVDGDGVDDIVVGVPLSDVVVPECGAVRVYSGATRALLYEFTDTQWSGWIGWAVANVGDLDGDGYSEVFMGAPWYDLGGGDCGVARLYSGLTGAVLFQPGGS